MLFLLIFPTMSNLKNYKLITSSKSTASLAIFDICVNSNCPPDACFIFKSSICFNFLFNVLIFFSVSNWPPETTPAAGGAFISIAFFRAFPGT